jgi:hypothetical protein
MNNTPQRVEAFSNQPIPNKECNKEMELGDIREDKDTEPR